MRSTYIRCCPRYDMRLTDASVLEYIASRQTTTTYQQIATAIDCSTTTARRAIKRLIQQGRLARVGAGGRWSYTYEVIHAQLSHPNRVAIDQCRAG